MQEDIENRMCGAQVDHMYSSNPPRLRETITELQFLDWVNTFIPYMQQSTYFHENFLILPTPVIKAGHKYRSIIISVYQLTWGKLILSAQDNGLAASQISDREGKRAESAVRLT